MARARHAWQSPAVYTQDFDPVAHSLGLTAVIAALPILTLIVLLGAMKMKAQWAVPIALVVAIGVATAVYGMPVDQAVLSAAEGAAFGLFPIMWIVVAAIWVYNMTVETGHFAVLRRSIASVSEDQRIQAVLIAFCFGTLLEALAGFGAPAAITAAMMVALGFKPIKAAALAAAREHGGRPVRRARDPDRDPVSRSPGSTRASSARWSAARRRCWR